MSVSLFLFFFSCIFFLNVVFRFGLGLFGVGLGVELGRDGVLVGLVVLDYLLADALRSTSHAGGDRLVDLSNGGEVVGSNGGNELHLADLRRLGAGLGRGLLSWHDRDELLDSLDSLDRSGLAVVASGSLLILRNGVRVEQGILLGLEDLLLGCLLLTNLLSRLL